MFDPLAFLRSVAFAVVYAGIEYRYVNRREADWTRSVPGFYEREAFWVIAPYQFYFLLPLFVVAAFTPSVTAWAANAFLIAVVEDVAYFGWRGKGAAKGEWTTTLFGSFSIGSFVVPVWWPLDLVIAAVLYAFPV